LSISSHAFRTGCSVDARPAILLVLLARQALKRLAHVFLMHAAQDTSGVRMGQSINALEYERPSSREAAARGNVLAQMFVFDQAVEAMNAQ
jgi:hypothetical protein